jgi:hypothetical protein
MSRLRIARHLLAAKTEDVRNETRVEETTMSGIEWADSIGVDIISSVSRIWCSITDWLHPIVAERRHRRHDRGRRHRRKSRHPGCNRRK